MTVDLGSLNDNQRVAVSWKEGPVLVLAGPGSGKTRVLTFHIARLIEENENATALALTFTNKAAAEMRERVEALLGQYTDRARLGTFHSFAVDLLRQHGNQVGLRPDFNLITQDEDRIAILDDVVAALPEYDVPIPADLRELLKLIDRLFVESYNGGDTAPSLVRTPDWLPDLFEHYCSTLVEYNRLDFGSLLHFARRLLNTKPGVARAERISWNHIFVDEFQDTNRAQYDLLRLLAPQRNSAIFVVGDDDQIIYQWNGASPERLKDLQKDYEIGVVQLPECYRCPSPIISIANRLIAHNRGRIQDKTPITARGVTDLDSNPVRYGVFATPEEEGSFVPSDIRERGLSPGECVVLGRTVKLVERAAGALAQAGFLAHLARRKSDFETAPVTTMFQALRLANARHDHEVLRQLCVGWGKLSGQPLAVNDVAASAALVGGDFLRAWADAAASSAIGVDAVSRIRSDLVDSLAFSEIVEWFLHDHGWQSWGYGDDRDVAEEVNTWRELHGEITREYGRNGLTLNTYLQQMDLASKSTRPDRDAVRCMTVHGAKGLEFKHVYLIGVAQEILPSFHALRKGRNSKELEEERRNCFVAITRVEQTLTMTRSEQYYGYSKGPSQFLAEMGIRDSR